MPEWHRRQSVRKDSGNLNAASRFRALRNIIKQMRVLLSEAPRQGAHWLNNVEGFDND
jgi:hypothetical protein